MTPKAKNAVGQLFSTHPSMEKRIAALDKIETQLQLGRTA
jgi:heat shock protein HtpX